MQQVILQPVISQSTPRVGAGSMKAAMLPFFFIASGILTLWLRRRNRRERRTTGQPGQSGGLSSRLG